MGLRISLKRQFVLPLVAVNDPAINWEALYLVAKIGRPKRNFINPQNRLGSQPKGTTDLGICQGGGRRWGGGRLRRHCPWRRSGRRALGGPLRADVSEETHGNPRGGRGTVMRAVHRGDRVLWDRMQLAYGFIGEKEKYIK